MGPHGPYFTDFVEILHATQWLRVLASRRLYAELRRPVDPEHLIGLLDVFAAYASRGSWYIEEEFEPVPIERREPLARKLQDLMSMWEPPELPPEIREAARTLLHAEGYEEPEGGWDELVHEDSEPLEGMLLWPEGIPAVLREQAVLANMPPGPPMTVEEFLGPKHPHERDEGHGKIVCAGTWNGAVLYGVNVVLAADGRRPPGADWGDVFGTIVWLMVLACPPLYRTLVRSPGRAHLLRLIDTFIAYAARREHLTPVKRSHRRFLRLDQREALARELRALMETWTPPDLPQAITDAARALVEAEGLRPPKDGWNALEHDKPYPLEEILLWSEGMPMALASRPQ